MTETAPEPAEPDVTEEPETGIADELAPDEELTPDDASAGEPDEEPAPATSREQASDAEADAKLGKLDKRAASYSKSVVEILGEDLLGLVPCELCSDHWPGLRAPVQPPAETVGKLRELIGMPALGNFKADPEMHACQRCDGHGAVLTGSKVQRYEKAQCPRCHGKGYEGGAQAGNGAATAEEAEEFSVLVPEEEDETPDTDPWGRPRGDPDFYRMPIPGART